MWRRRSGFKFDGSTFKYTTREFHMPDYSPFAVDRLIGIVEFTNTSAATFSYKVKYEGFGTWGQEYNVRLDQSEGNKTLIGQTLEQIRAVRRIQLQITAMSSNLKFRELRLDATVDSLDDYVD